MWRYPTWRRAARALASAAHLYLGLAAGLVIGLIQAATSVNEQTLTFVPKLIGVGIALLVCTPPWSRSCSGCAGAAGLGGAAGAAGLAAGAAAAGLAAAAAGCAPAPFCTNSPALKVA